MIEEKQKNASITNEPYFGPGNTLHGYGPTLQLDTVNTIARRHDMDVNYAFRLKGQARDQALAKADAKFTNNINKAYRAGKITRWKMIQAKAVGTAVGKAYYKSLAKPKKD